MNYNVTLQNFKKNDNINHEIYSRQFPSQQLNMNFSPRSVSTKYSILPILDHRKETSVPMNNYPIYDSNSTFFPGTSKPHFCGFAKIVDLESSLRSQFFALQKADQAKYIPSSDSNLYEHSIDFVNTNQDLTNHLLFQRPSFNDFNPNLSNTIGNEIFLNSTKVQLKNL